MLRVLEGDIGRKTTGPLCGLLRKKFEQTLDADVYETLTIVARANGLALPELLRRFVIPDWMRITSQQYRRVRRTQRVAGRC